MIDLLNFENTCNDFPDFPIQINFAFGGLLKNNLPLICGGWSGNHSNSNCYIVGDNEIVAELNLPRDSGASVILLEEVLWVTGGHTIETRSSSEFIRLNQPTLPGIFSSLVFILQYSADCLLS